MRPTEQGQCFPTLVTHHSPQGNLKDNAPAEEDAGICIPAHSLGDSDACCYVRTTAVKSLVCLLAYFSLTLSLGEKRLLGFRVLKGGRFSGGVFSFESVSLPGNLGDGHCPLS